MLEATLDFQHAPTYGLVCSGGGLTPLKKKIEFSPLDASREDSQSHVIAQGSSASLYVSTPGSELPLIGDTVAGDQAGIQISEFGIDSYIEPDQRFDGTHPPLGFENTDLCTFAQQVRTHRGVEFLSCRAADTDISGFFRKSWNIIDLPQVSSEFFSMELFRFYLDAYGLSNMNSPSGLLSDQHNHCG